MRLPGLPFLRRWPTTEIVAATCTVAIIAAIVLSLSRSKKVTAEPKRSTVPPAPSLPARSEAALEEFVRNEEIFLRFCTFRLTREGRLDWQAEALRDLAAEIERRPWLSFKPTEILNALRSRKNALDPLFAVFMDVTVGRLATLAKIGRITDTEEVGRLNLERFQPAGVDDPLAAASRFIAGASATLPRIVGARPKALVLTQGEFSFLWDYARDRNGYTIDAGELDARIQILKLLDEAFLRVEGNVQIEPGVFQASIRSLEVTRQIRTGQVKRPPG